MSEARLFPSACVVSPHHLASSAGLAVLASGGNAVDAAVAMNLTLGVVTPYLCGFGGDLFALVWKAGVQGGSSNERSEAVADPLARRRSAGRGALRRRNGAVFAYNGSGRAPAAATVEAVRAAVGGERMPAFGPHTVTVPGAVEAWFVLLKRFGTRSFADLAQPGLRFAAEGFVPSAMAMASLERAAQRYQWSREWRAVYGGAERGRRFVQPDLARTLDLLCKEGPDAYYREPIANAIVEHLRSQGGLMGREDLAGHRGDWVEPLGTNYRGLDVLELPPNTQGVTALEALNIASAAGSVPEDGPERQHLLVEAMKLALADRDAHVTDPDHMRMPPQELASMAWAESRARLIDARAAVHPPPGSAAGGGTAYMCAADGEGMCVSLIQSNYMGFGSGVTVPGWGINLQNRGASFSLDRGHVNVIAPRKRTMHTLIPALALRDGRPWLVFGTMGGDGQPQTHLQLLVRIVDDGLDVQEAIDAPRWFVSPEDWSVSAESRFSPAVIEGLRSRGHRVSLIGPYDSLLGHAHGILVTDQGYAAAADPRFEGAALGL